MSDKQLFVGIGSPHGDDAAGWLIAERIAPQAGQRLEVRRAQSPTDLLDWLDGVDTLDVCDAVICDAPPGTVLCWPWPDRAIAAARFRGSHDVSLAAALTLAEQLGRLPRRVRVWGVVIEQAGELEPVSAAVSAAVPAIVEEILGVVDHA